MIYARIMGIESLTPNARAQDGHFLDRLEMRFCTHTSQKTWLQSFSAVLRRFELQTGQIATRCRKEISGGM